VRELSQTLQPFASTGFYPNYDADANPDQVVNAFVASVQTILQHNRLKRD
jgi:hypothetical protein